MRFRLRTLLIVLALAPPFLAVVWRVGTSEMAMVFLILTIAFAGYLAFAFALGFAIAWTFDASLRLIAWLVKGL